MKTSLLILLLSFGLSAEWGTSFSVRTANDDTKPLDYELSIKLNDTNGKFRYLLKRDWERELGEEYVDDIVNSISYILYKDYFIDKKTYKIAEHSGWRKINSLNTTENVKLYLHISKICKAFYHWKPSNFVKPGLLRSEHYFKFPIKEFFLKIKEYKTDNFGDLEIYDQCPDFIDDFLSYFNEKFYLTLKRSVKFYKWRIDNYPIGSQKYFLKKNNHKIISLLVSQIHKNKAMIVDLIADDFNESVEMMKNFINYCKENRIDNTKFATSNKELIEKIEKAFDYKSFNTESFLFIKNLVNQNLLDKEVLIKSETFETYASGDVLIR